VDEGPAIMIKMSRLEFAPSLQRYVPNGPQRLRWLDDRLAVVCEGQGQTWIRASAELAARLRRALDMRRIERAARSNLGEALPGGRSQYVP